MRSQFTATSTAVTTFSVVLGVVGVLSGHSPVLAVACPAARSACFAAANQAAAACRSQCRRLAAPGCATDCAMQRDALRDACRAVDPPCAAVCGDAVDAPTCRALVRGCRATTRDELRACRRACDEADVGGRRGCFERCARDRAAGTAACGYVVAATAAGPAALPDRPPGQPADLTLLEPAERDAIAAADARADALRTRPVRLWIGRPGVTVRVIQTRHGFPFGFPIDLRRFASTEERDWYAATMAAHFGLVVIENTQKWAGIEPAEGMRVYDAADADVTWGGDLGLPVKGHALLWGITPPFSSSGVPGWALTRFSPLPLAADEADALREILRRHVVDLVDRYRGRVHTWDATNETLQPLGQWFAQRLGPDVVDDVFRWAHETDPDAQLVFNEWIVEVFTGFPAPTAADVRDRVLALRAAGVPVHAVGQQAHFVPAAAFAGGQVDLTERTHLDAYAQVLDTLAEAGLPIHITETNVIAPDDPELRAAQAEGLLRLWWGHPAVEQVVFWGPWNKVAGRDEFDVGFWDDDRQITRHGAAVLALLNGRWRTDVEAVSDAYGTVELVATHGTHAAQWDLDGQPVHALFAVPPGSTTATIAIAGP
jgi:endo-1,4-beta-xylanase